jgi:hypothetical protein
MELRLQRELEAQGPSHKRAATRPPRPARAPGYLIHPGRAAADYINMMHRAVCGSAALSGGVGITLTAGEDGAVTVGNLAEKALRRCPRPSVPSTRAHAPR